MYRWIWFCLIVLSACSESPPRDPSEAGAVRIISLSPAITRTLEESGLGPQLVGRSAWCRLRTRSEEGVPAVGDLHDRDWEMMVRLRPTHVLIQADSVATDGQLQSLARQHGWSVQAWPLRTMGDVRAMLGDLPAVCSDTELVTEISERTERLIQSIDRALEQSDETVETRVLMVSDGLPPLAWGESTYLGEILAAEGVQNVVGSVAWITITAEDVVRLDPDIILVVSPPNESGIPDIARLDTAAAREERIHRVGIEDVNFPGPHLATMRDLIRRATDPARESHVSPETR